MKLTFLKYASLGCAAFTGSLIGIGIFNQFRLGYDLHIFNGFVLFFVFLFCMSGFATATMGSASKMMEWMEQSPENRQQSKIDALYSLAFTFAIPFMLLYITPAPSDIRLVWGPDFDVISFLKAPLSELLIPIGISMIPAVLFGGLYYLSIKHKTTQEHETTL